MPNDYLTEILPGEIPVPYKSELIPEGMLVHRGTFSPDLNEFYFTVSDRNFEHFDVLVVQKSKNSWSAPEEAFFNTQYNEHGLSFSPDGKVLYFCSTRPVGIAGIPDTWHLWRSELISGRWTEPEFVDIPNLRDKLASHPAVTRDGTIYFHAGELDYSNLKIYRSAEEEGKFADAVLLPAEINFSDRQNSPYVSPDESFLLFESVPDLYIAFQDRDGRWTSATRLKDSINRHGKGNPVLSPDRRYLFYAAGSEADPERVWSVYWVDFKKILDREGDGP